MRYSFPNLEPVCFSMSGSSCCFLTYIQISQGAGKVVWFSHLLKNFPVYCDPHSQSFVFNKTVDVFLELSCFFNDPVSGILKWFAIPFSSGPRFFSELSTMTHPPWVALQGATHCFIELDKVVVHVISLISFLWLWFSFCLPFDE